MIEFNCAQCNAPMRAPAESAGKKGRCSECGEIQKIPTEPKSPTSQSSPAGSGSEMISLRCSQCGEELRVPAASAGKKGRCPKCATINRIPDSSTEKPTKSTSDKTAASKQSQQQSATSGNMTFGCPECGQSITVPNKVAGKKGKCPQCTAIIPIPHKTTTAPKKRTGTPAASQPSKAASSGKSTATSGSIEFRCPQCNRFVKTPASSAGKKGKCPGCQSVFDIPHQSTAKQPQADNLAAAGEIPGLTPVSDGLQPLDDGLTPVDDSGLTPIGGGAADPFASGTDPFASPGLDALDDGLTPVGGGDGLTPLGGAAADPLAGGGLDSLNTPMSPIQATGQASPYTPPTTTSFPQKPGAGRKKSLMVQIPAGIMIGVAGINLILRGLYAVWTLGSGTFAAMDNANFGADQQAAMQIGVGVGVAMLIGLFIVDALLIAGFTQMLLARRYAVAVISLIIGLFLYVFPGCCCYFPLALPLNGIAMIAVIIGFVGVLTQDGKRTFID